MWYLHINDAIDYGVSINLLDDLVVLLLLVPLDLINAEVGIISFTLVTQLLLARNAKAYILDVEYRWEARDDDWCYVASLYQRAL